MCITRSCDTVSINTWDQWFTTFKYGASWYIMRCSFKMCFSRELWGHWLHPTLKQPEITSSMAHSKHPSSAFPITPPPPLFLSPPQEITKQTNYLQILSAQDKELNQWISLKKILRYRRDEQKELRDKQVYQHRSSLLNVKQKILPSLFVE